MKIKIEEIKEFCISFCLDIVYLYFSTLQLDMQMAHTHAISTI